MNQPFAPSISFSTTVSHPNRWYSGSFLTFKVSGITAYPFLACQTGNVV